MNSPCLYHRANNVQRHDAAEIIKEYAHALQWRLDGCDALLDVGSGSGDVLMDFIYPIMPKNFEKLVCSDISPKMINYAKDFYNSYDKCEFEILDIGMEKDLPNDLKGKFDHVTSFYCLHWLQNKRQAVHNIYNLIKPEGGDCLLVFLASNPVYDVYKLLSESNKWSCYMKDVDQFINPLHYSSNPGLEFSSMLKEAEFTNVQVEVKHKVYGYGDVKSFKDNVRAINPFLDRIPPSLHDSYFDDFIEFVKNFNLKDSGLAFNLPYTLIVAYARK